MTSNLFLCFAIYLQISAAFSFSVVLPQMAMHASIPAIIGPTTPLPKLHETGFSIATYNVLMPNRLLIRILLGSNMPRKQHEVMTCGAVSMGGGCTNTTVPTCRQSIANGPTAKPSSARSSSVPSAPS